MRLRRCFPYRWLLVWCTTLIVALIQPSVSAVSPPPVALPEAPPPLQAHPLPPTLAQWQTPDSSDDYFSAIQPTPAGYLIWSQFPITVYLEPAVSAAADRANQWTAAVTEAVQEWNPYLPLQQVDTSETANITIWRSAPPLQANATGSPRAQTAETRFQLFIDRTVTPPLLSQRFTMHISPNQTPDYIKATARHELGHALGIWGHSPQPTDVMYFSQVRSPAAISHRDVNTLKRIYEQPTHIGWAVSR